MGGRTVSPGGALLRTSRVFSLPKPLPEPPSTNLRIGDHKSNTMTRQYPQHQSITSPLSSREKGDWGFKRPFPLKSTMATSTPLIRVKQVDTIENVTNFTSAADHTLSLEKFQELRVAMSIPKTVERGPTSFGKLEFWHKSVFEEDMDFTDFERGQGDDRRWKFQGPWLARMTEGQFTDYLNRKVRPKRAQFRRLLKERLAEDITTSQNNKALEAGIGTTPPPVTPNDITEAQFTDYLCSLRNDRVTLYALVSKFLDLAPLGDPGTFTEAIWANKSNNAQGSPYGKSGPPPSHPSAGIGYLRTSSFMENHQLYGPQAQRTPSVARVVYPRVGPEPAKLGLGGFVANAPSGDNEFNLRYGKMKTTIGKPLLDGIMHLDTTTIGGAKAYVEAPAASVDPSGKVVLQLRETSAEAQLVAKESKGLAKIYDAAPIQRDTPSNTSEDAGPERRVESSRFRRVANEITSPSPERRNSRWDRDSFSS